MNQKIRARRRFITRDQGLGRSTEQLADSPLNQSSIAHGSFRNTLAAAATAAAVAAADRKSSLSSETSNFHPGAEDIPWTDSSETTCSGSNVSRLKDFWSHPTDTKHSASEAASHRSSTAVSESCFKPILSHHRGSSASESSSMAGIFSSTGGESTPVGSRSRRVVPFATSPSEHSRLDVVTHVVSPASPSGSSGGGQTFPSKSSSANIMLQTKRQNAIGDAVVGASTTSTSTCTSSHLQPVIVLQPRTVAKLQTSMSSSATKTTSTNIGLSVSAPSGASKLVHSPTSAFSATPSAGIDPLEPRPTDAVRERGRSATRHQRQAPSLSVRRMAMLFEEPSRPSDLQPHELLFPAASSPAAMRVAMSRSQSQTVRSKAANEIVNSELFFFTAVNEQTNKPSAATQRLSPDGAAVVSLTAHSATIDDKSKFSDVGQLAYDPTANTLANVRHSKVVIPAVSSATLDCQARHIIVVGNESKSASLIRRRDLVEDTLPSRLEFETKSGVINRNQVSLSGEYRPASGRLIDSHTRNVPTFQVIFDPDVVNSCGVKSSTDPQYILRSTKNENGTRYSKENVSDSIETAISELETAISMLGYSVVGRTNTFLSPGGREKRPRPVSTHSIQETGRDAVNQISSKNTAERIKVVGRAHNAPSLQNTIKLLDKTIGEINSAISVSDYLGDCTSTLTLNSSTVGRWTAISKQSTRDMPVALLDLSEGKKPLPSSIRGRQIEGKTMKPANQNIFLAEKQIDIWNAKNDPIIGNTQRNNALSAKKPTDFDNYGNRSKVRRLPEVCSTRVVLHEFAGSRLTSSGQPVSGVQHRRAAPPFTREDSLSRSDSPLFTEKLPLPVESSIRRYRQKHGNGSRSNGRSSQQQKTRPSSSSDSDTGQKKTMQSSRRNQRRRSASAGARLQGRERRRRDRQTEASEERPPSNDSESLESEVDDVIEQRLITAGINSVLASRSQPRVSSLDTVSNSDAERSNIFAMNQSETKSDATTTVGPIESIAQTDISAALAQTARIRDTPVTAGVVTHLEPSYGISMAAEGRPDEQTMSVGRPTFPEPELQSVEGTETNSVKGTNSNFSTTDNAHQNANPADELDQINEKTFPVLDSSLSSAPSVQQAPTAAPCAMTLTDTTPLSSNPSDDITRASLDDRQSSSLTNCASLPTSSTESDYATSNSLACNDDDECRSITTEAVPDALSSAATAAEVVTATVDLSPVSDVRLVVRQLKSVVSVRPDVVECVLVPVTPTSDTQNNATFATAESSSCSRTHLFPLSNSPTASTSSVHTQSTSDTPAPSGSESSQVTCETGLFCNGCDTSSVVPGACCSDNLDLLSIRKSAEKPEVVPTQQNSSQPILDVDPGFLVSANQRKSNDVDHRSLPIETLPKNRKSSDSTSGKARMKIVDISACLNGDNTLEVHLDQQLPNGYNDIEQRAKSLAELDSIATQTRLMSASVGSSKAADRKTQSSCSTDAKVRASAQSVQALRGSGPIAKVAPPPVPVRTAIPAGGIVRKHLIYLDSIASPATASSVISAATGVTSSSPSSSSSAKRVVRRSQTVDFVSVGSACPAAQSRASKTQPQKLDRNPATSSLSTKTLSFRPEVEEANNSRRATGVTALSGSTPMSKLDRAVPTRTSQSRLAVVTADPMRSPLGISERLLQPRVSSRPLSSSSQTLSNAKSLSSIKSERNQILGIGIKSTTKQSPVTSRRQCQPIVSSSSALKDPLIADDDLDRMVEINTRYSTTRVSIKPVSK